MNNEDIIQRFLKEQDFNVECNWYELKEAIENLIERNKDLEEDNYVYHQLMQMQNKREYRSKFLKDFKLEYGENVMPDYDEIYKRYDKMKKQLIDIISKSKIIAKIEELKRELKLAEKQHIDTIKAYTPIDIIRAEIKRLEELLEGDDK